jgi:hypothetical protein
MRVLASLLADLIVRAKEDVIAKGQMAVFCLSLCFLQPIGILLKRYQVTHLNPDTEAAYDKVVYSFGCYYIVSQVIMIGAATSFLMAALGQHHVLDTVCFGQLFVALSLAILNLWIINLYVTPLTHKPFHRLLESRQAELLGDLCLLLNLILWQMFWGFLMWNFFQPSPAPINEELLWISPFLPQPEYTTLAKLGWFLGSVFIFYIPQRFIYLIDERQYRLTWLTILLANSPVLFRILFPHKF